MRAPKRIHDVSINAPPETTCTLPLRFYTVWAISGTNTTAAVTISAGQAADSTGVKYLNGPGHSWSVANGNAANGYQGGTTLPNGTTILFFECWGASGYCSFASTSLTPTLPTGYNTYYRRVFSLLTNSSGALPAVAPTEVYGGSMPVWLPAQITDINAATPTTATRTLYTLSVPTGIKVQVLGRSPANAFGNGVTGIYTSPDETDVAPSASNIYIPIPPMTKDIAVLPLL